MFTKKIFPLALAIGAAMACGGAGGSGSTGPSQSNNNPPTTTPPTTTNSGTVTVSDNAFNPTAVTVSPGATVTWKWAACDGGNGDGYGGYGSGSSGACTSHNITFDDGSNVTSQTQASGEFSRTFATAGTYKFHCSIHGAAVMSGQIVVK